MVFGKRKRCETEESISAVDGIPVKRMRTEGSSSSEETELTTRESSPTLTITAKEENEVLLIILGEDDNSVVENDTSTKAESPLKNDSPDSGPHLDDVVQSSETNANDEPIATVDQEPTSPTPPEKEFFLGPWSPSWPQNSRPTFDKSPPSPSEEEDSFDFLQHETEGASPTSQIAREPEAASPPSLDAPSPVRRDHPSVSPHRVPQVEEEEDNEEEDLPFGVPLLLLIPDDTDDS